jgi:hypothetical protein
MPSGGQPGAVTAIIAAHLAEAISPFSLKHALRTASAESYSSCTDGPSSPPGVTSPAASWVSCADGSEVEASPAKAEEECWKQTQGALEAAKADEEFWKPTQGTLAEAEEAEVVEEELPTSLALAAADVAAVADAPPRWVTRSGGAGSCHNHEAPGEGRVPPRSRHHPRVPHAGEKVPRDDGAALDLRPAPARDSAPRIFQLMGYEPLASPALALSPSQSPAAAAAAAGAPPSTPVIREVLAAASAPPSAPVDARPVLAPPADYGTFEEGGESVTAATRPRFFGDGVGEEVLWEGEVDVWEDAGGRRGSLALGSVGRGPWRWRGWS